MSLQKNLIKVAISDIELVDSMYPRSEPLRSRVDDLEIVLRSKGKFDDAMVVAQLKGRKGFVLVDGAHRREVFIRIGIENVEVENLGFMTKQEIIEEALKRNDRGPLPILRTDMRVCARKMQALGISDDRIHALTRLPIDVIKSLSGIVFRDAQSHLSHVPRALTNRDNRTGAIRLKQGITQADIQKYADVVSSIPHTFSPKQAMRHLNSMLDYNWLDIVKDKDARELAGQLYAKLGEALKP